MVEGGDKGAGRLAQVHRVEVLVLGAQVERVETLVKLFPSLTYDRIKIWAVILSKDRGKISAVVVPTCY